MTGTTWSAVTEIAHDLGEEPCSTFRLGDPGLDRAGRGEIVVLFADLMGGTLVPLAERALQPASEYRVDSEQTAAESVAMPAERTRTGD
jgi:hypothetical protein